MNKTLLPVTITAFIEESEFGNIVEFSFKDIKDKEHSFSEKWQLVSSEELTNKTKYPLKGFLIIEILKDGINTFEITTSENNRLISNQEADKFTIWKSDIK